MTTKDYVYLGLIALSAVVFYGNGYYAGVGRTRRTLERWFTATEKSDDLATNACDEAPAPRVTEVEELPGVRHRLHARPAPTIRVTFGRN